MKKSDALNFLWIMLSYVFLPSWWPVSLTLSIEYGCLSWEMKTDPKNREVTWVLLPSCTLRMYWKSAAVSLLFWRTSARLPLILYDMCDGQVTQGGLCWQTLQVITGLLPLHLAHTAWVRPKLKKSWLKSIWAKLAPVNKWLNLEELVGRAYRVVWNNSNLNLGTFLGLPINQVVM